jgi:NADH-quinone oxidoreductase subunit E
VRVMLTDQERRDVVAEVEASEEPRVACLEALKVVQRNRGYVADEAIADLAPMLGMTADELDSVATFYSHIFRKPVGRHVILICDSVTCWIMGYESLLEHLRERLGIGFGETTEDNRFTLLPVSCIGACDHAPAMIVDGTMHSDLDVQKLDEILGTYQ